MTAPTWGFASEIVEQGRTKVTYFDLGGGARIRGIWPRYFAEVYGVIYVVDATDEGRLEESKAAFFESIDDSRVSGKPILVVANKQDLPTALSAEEVAKRLGLVDVKSCPYRIVGGTALTAVGAPMDAPIAKGMQWMMGYIYSNFDALGARVAKETVVQKEKERIEAEERRQRVEKMREERRRQQELEEQEEARKQEEAANPSGPGSTGGEQPTSATSNKETEESDRVLVSAALPPVPGTKSSSEPSSSVPPPGRSRQSVSDTVATAPPAETHATADSETSDMPVPVTVRGRSSSIGQANRPPSRSNSQSAVLLSPRRKGSTEGGSDQFVLDIRSESGTPYRGDRRSLDVIVDGSPVSGRRLDVDGDLENQSGSQAQLPGSLA
jgi:GTPase SAR1 family protein